MEHVSPVGDYSADINALGPSQKRGGNLIVSLFLSFPCATSDLHLFGCSLGWQSEGQISQEEEAFSFYN